MDKNDPPTPQIENIIHRWGSIGSEFFFDQPHSYFSVPGIDGIIGYRIQSNCAISFGDPICSFETRPHLAELFQRFCQEKGLNIIYLVTSQEFAKCALNHHYCKIMIEVGEQLLFDPQNDPREGPKGNKIRNMTGHAKRLGLVVTEYLNHDPNVEEAVQQVAKNWLTSKKGSYIHLSNLQFFDRRYGRRWFYISDGATIVGAALLCRREAYQGWMLKYLVSNPDAPRGTSELLIISILDTLKNENCRYFNYGIIPALQIGEVKGLGKFSETIAKSVYKVINWTFHFEDHRTYWQKFHPKREPFYLLFGDASIGLREIRALMNSLKI